MRLIRVPALSEGFEDSLVLLRVAEEGASRV
jgi:hypothetical protein